MIVITGAAGFIGSFLAGYLNRQGYRDLVLVDDFEQPAKEPNWRDKQFSYRVQREELIPWLGSHRDRLQAILHMGARTDTTETDEAIFNELNLHYSQALWQEAVAAQVPLIYASSAATYGGGELGFADEHSLVPQLRPLNAYGRSKQAFDEWVLQQTQAPFYWAGLKFFNVFGPNEYHKGRMASVVYHAYRQVKAHGQLKLFQSHHADYADGEQKRDFIYVKDVARIVTWLLTERPQSGLFNVGTGQARSFKDLASALFEAMEAPYNVTYIPTPEELRPTYQYFTQAEMGKLRQAGYPAPCHSLEQGIADYVRNYLMTNKYY
jgi:ADP-L-glycero-D-manno-heptose 6-epimerase